MLAPEVSLPAGSERTKRNRRWRPAPGAQLSLGPRCRAGQRLALSPGSVPSIFGRTSRVLATGAVTTMDCTQSSATYSQCGDSPPLSELFNRYRDRLRLMVHLRLDRRLQARIDSSDVLQEAFLEA